MALIAMMLFAVQGYAQREAREQGRRNSFKTETRSSGNSRSRNSASSYLQDRRSATRSTDAFVSKKSVSTSSSSVRQRENRETYSTKARTRTSSNQRMQTRQTSRGDYRPVYRHHEKHYHHSYRCIFDNWYWYSWHGYNNRFICHSYYNNRFFDSLLGYYLWGSLETPDRIDLGDLSITRQRGRLKIFTGRNTTYLDLYHHKEIIYKVGYTTVKISTSNGHASIYIYDEYGNTAKYWL